MVAALASKKIGKDSGSCPARLAVLHEDLASEEERVPRRPRDLDRRMKPSHTVRPRTITVDKNSRLSEREQIDEEGGRVVALRTSAASQIPNNIVEQDHRRIKRLVRPGLGFKSMSSARQIICGYEIFAMIRKGQVKRIPANDMGAQRTLIASLFAIAA